jgi:hypothetical protein
MTRVAGALSGSQRGEVPPTVDEYGAEHHPAWGVIGASRVQSTGTYLFDSDMRHQHYVVVTLRQARRTRDLNHDRIMADSRLPIVEVAMSEAQWASFVSSMNTGDGVPCTIERRDGQRAPGFPHEARLAESMREVSEAADKSLEAIREAFALVEAKPTKANIRNLGIVLGNAPASMRFAASSLTEHAENVVQRARADLEAMVVAKAAQIGLDPASFDVAQLGTGADEANPS